MIIVSVVMTVLLAVAIVIILALLTIVLKQRKQAQTMKVAATLHVTPVPLYDNVTDNPCKQNIELSGNIAYGQIMK